MKLTDTQQQRISAYLRDVRARLAPLPEEERQGVISRLAARIRRDIEQSGALPPNDRTIESVLSACGSPAEQACVVLGGGGTGEGTFLAWNSRVLLGVCGGFAERFDVPLFAVRGVVCVLGLILPLLPFVLALYLGVFFYTYAKADRGSLPRIGVAGLLQSAGKAFGIALALFLGVKALVWFIAYAHIQLLERPYVSADQWGWLERENGSMFIWALLFALPLAILSALPVPKAWQGTLRKVVQAALAVYALALCFGIASLMVGVIIEAAKDFGGPTSAPFLTNLFRS